MIGKGLIQGRSDEGYNVILMMPCRLLGEEPLACGGDVSFAGVGEGLVGLLVGIVAEDANANFVGRSFDSEDGCLTVSVGVEIVEGCRGDGEVANGVGAGIVGGCRCCHGDDDDDDVMDK